MSEDEDEFDRPVRAKVLPVERKRAPKCSECGTYPADLPSKLCPGCDAYREHTGAMR